LQFKCLISFGLAQTLLTSSLAVLPPSPKAQFYRGVFSAFASYPHDFAIDEYVLWTMMTTAA
jgi:hypothetical protein